MADTIKGIKTADGVVHKINGAALAYEKALITETTTMKYAVPLILGADYSQITGDTGLLFFFGEHDNENDTTVGVERVLKAHKMEDDPNTLYFSPVFSDNNFYITSTDKDGAVYNENSFWVSFSSNAATTNYLSSSAQSCNTEGSSFGIITDCLTALVAQSLGQGSSSFFHMRNNEDFLPVTTNEGNAEILPTSNC